MTKKKIVIYMFILLAIGFAIWSLFPKKDEASSEKKEGIDNFPASYQPYLKELQKQYPNWKFTALYTGLDWKYVIDNENKFGKNLVPKSYSKAWKNTKPGEYNVEVDAGWVDCSRRAVEYTMDPRNFLNYARIFQFEGLSYDAKTNNKDGIEKILYGTEFYNKIVKYLTSSGNTITMTKKYSDLILTAGQTSKVSSYHLASRIKQEVGPFLSHSSISGNVEGYKGLYNFYNIGATSSSEPMGAIKNGLRYAKDGKGASQQTKDKYLIPWNTKEKAITGGGIFIGSSYIHGGQDTIYLQKFHVTSNSGGSLFWHQYMTNVLAPYSESRIIYDGYAKTGLLQGSMSFIIPVYNNMPSIPVQSPAVADSDFVSDNTKVYANVSSSLNVRSGPSTSYEVLTDVAKNVEMTRIAKGRQSGELWDRVKLSDGIIGYVFQNYVKEVPKKQIEKINVSIDNNTIQKGETKKLTVEILPKEAAGNAIIFTSSNSNIARVDSSGNILGIRSGKATITVKAKQNNVSNTIEVQVHSPVTDMTLNTQDFMLQVGDKFKLQPVILPDDASNKNVTFYSENEQIAQIDTQGNIIAIAEGKVVIGATSEDNKIEKKVELTVVEKIDETKLSFDASLKVVANEIIGWNENEMTVAKIKEKINTEYTIEIYDSKGNLLENGKEAGTGSKIRILENDNIIMEYIIILYGDVNGDGKINSVDLLVLQRHILEIEKLTCAFLKAGNIRKDGKNPTSLDSLLIQRHVLELQSINQRD